MGAAADAGELGPAVTTYTFRSDGRYLPEGEYLVQVSDDGDPTLAWRPNPDTAVVWGPPVRGEQRA